MEVALVVTRLSRCAQQLSAPMMLVSITSTSRAAAGRHLKIVHYQQDGRSAHRRWQKLAEVAKRQLQ
jgi:hypothetical protein